MRAGDRRERARAGRGAGARGDRGERARRRPRGDLLAGGSRRQGRRGPGSPAMARAGRIAGRQPRDGLAAGFLAHGSTTLSRDPPSGPPLMRFGSHPDRSVVPGRAAERGTGPPRPPRAAQGCNAVGGRIHHSSAFGRARGQRTAQRPGSGPGNPARPRAHGPNRTTSGWLARRECSVIRGAIASTGAASLGAEPPASVRRARPR